MRTIKITLIMAAGLLFTSAACGQTVDEVLSQMTMFGINRNNARLSRYDFSTHELQTVGTIQSASGTTMTGIDASAYVPGHLNLFAFWQDAGDGQSKLVYVNTRTAEGTVVGQPLGTGRITGAVAGTNSGYADVTGEININPNNSTANEFTLATFDGVTYTRDNLHEDAAVDAEGTFYAGQAHYVRVKPKGNGNQNGLIVDGVAFNMLNANTYTLVGPMTVRVYNDHINSNGKAMGHWWIQITSGTVSIFDGVGMVAGGSSNQAPWVVYALQSVVPQNPPDVAFAINDDHVVPTESYAAKVTVLGAAITYGGLYTVPVTIQFKVGAQTFEPFGDFGLALAGNVNDNQNPREFIFPGIFPAGTPIDVLGRSWVKKNNNSSGANESHWNTYMTVDGSTSNSPQVIVLRNGDAVPNIPGFQNQTNIADFVRDYVNEATHTVMLDANQAIYLFEAGTTNMGSPAADFQDLVVLVTLAKDPASFSAGPASRIIKIDQKAGGFSQIMTLDRVYDSLASNNDGLTFFATHDHDLYKIDVVNQTETLVGSMPRDNMFGLEMVNGTVIGFEIDGDTLIPMNSANGASVGDPTSVGMLDLGTIIFMPTATDPSTYAVSYD